MGRESKADCLTCGVHLLLVKLPLQAGRLLQSQSHGNEIDPCCAHNNWRDSQLLACLYTLPVVSFFIMIWAVE